LVPAILCSLGAPWQSNWHIYSRVCFLLFNIMILFWLLCNEY
jgi:hypothetical protein